MKSLKNKTHGPTPQTRKKHLFMQLTTFSIAHFLATEIKKKKIIFNSTPWHVPNSMTSAYASDILTKFYLAQIKKKP